MSQLLFCLSPHSITLQASFAVPGVWQGCQTVWRAEAWVFEFPYQSKLPSWGETGLRASISNASATHMPHAWRLLEGDQCPSPQLQQPLMVRTRPLIAFSGFVIHRTKFDICLIMLSQGVRMEICPAFFTAKHCGRAALDLLRQWSLCLSGWPKRCQMKCWCLCLLLSWQKAPCTGRCSPWTPSGISLHWHEAGLHEG